MTPSQELILFVAPNVTLDTDIEVEKSPVCNLSNMVGGYEKQLSNDSRVYACNGITHKKQLYKLARHHIIISCKKGFVQYQLPHAGAFGTA